MKEELFLDREGNIKWYKIGILRESHGAYFVEDMNLQILVSPNRISDDLYVDISYEKFSINQRVLIQLDDRLHIKGIRNEGFGKPLLNDSGYVTLRDYKQEYERLR
jgi:hypothetical protein